MNKNYSVNYNELIIGLILVAIGFFMPLFVNVYNSGVVNSLNLAMDMLDKTLLLEAALRLAAMNAVRAVPHYIGVYFIGESIKYSQNREYNQPMTLISIFIILRLTYLGIEKFHNIHYDFGIPVFLMLVWVAIIYRLRLQYVSLIKKAGTTSLFLMACQFLDLMPALRGFPVGRGETSWDVKQVAEVLEGEALLNYACLAALLIFSLFAILLLLQFREENTLIELQKLRERNQEILFQARVAEIKNRTNEEMHFLVHDLKSPLTVIETIVGAIRMEHIQENRETDLELLNKIENSAEHMSRMISDILGDTRIAPIQARKVFDTVLAQCSSYSLHSCLDSSYTAGEAVISANMILFPRALINLIQNSMQAILEYRDAKIVFEVSCERGEVIFKVSDNGKGIEKDKLDTIWEIGESGRGSSGLGLAFVKKVIEQMRGTIVMESELGKGTTVIITLNEVK